MQFNNFFNPALIYIISYLFWYFLPPFFVDGHNERLLFLNIIGILSFIYFYLFLSIIAKTVSFKNKLIIKDKEVVKLLFIIGVLVYGLRLYQFYNEGIAVFLHSYASTEGLYVSIKMHLTTSFVAILIYAYYLNKRKIYLLLILLELVQMVATTSRSSLLLFLFFLIIINTYVNGINMHKIRRYLIPVFVIFFTTIYLSVYLHPLRSLSMRSDLSKVTWSNYLDIEVDTYEKTFNALLSRINLHDDGWKLIEGNEQIAADLDAIALNEIVERLTFQVPTLDKGPGITASFKNKTRDNGVDSKSALVFPRYILLYYMGDKTILYIIVFSFFSAFFWAFLFNFLYGARIRNVLLVIVYIPMARNSLLFFDSNIAAHIFDIVLYLFSIAIPLLIYGFIQLVGLNLKAAR
jgi:hypothetical protein